MFSSGYDCYSLRSGKLVFRTPYGRGRCDICSKMDTIHKSCCGISTCFVCTERAGQLCYVHERDKINKPIVCNECYDEGTMLDMGKCEYCKQWWCSDCLRETGWYYPENCLTVCAKYSCAKTYVRYVTKITKEETRNEIKALLLLNIRV